MRSARDGDELRTGTNMRALLSAIASGREEIDRIGRRHGWSAGVKEEMLDRLQAMVREPLQRGGNLVMSSIPGPGGWRGYDGPQFSGRLEDLREFSRCWGEYERQYYPKEQEEVLVEILHTQALGPESRKAVSHARSLGTTWTYLENHLREQRERIDNLLSDTLRAGEPVGPEALYLYYRKVCQFLDTKEGESTFSCLITSWTCCYARWPLKKPLSGGGVARRPLRTCLTCSTISAGNGRRS
jgi:hypothetical protein